MSDAEFETTEPKFDAVATESDRTAEFKALAEYYEAHRDDPDEWEEAPAPHPVKRGRLAQVHSVRFEPEDAIALREAAIERGVTVSELLRQSTLNEIRGARKQTDDLVIVVRREQGAWWAEIVGHGEYVAGDPTFDGLCERLAEGLHVMGLSRERPVITFEKTSPAFRRETATSGQRTIVLWGQPA